PNINVRFVERIDEQAQRLQLLIFDVISLARIESGQHTFELTELSLEDAVHECIDAHRSTADAKSINLDTAPDLPPVSLQLDEEALREILDNLIDNAIKYTPANGNVNVSWAKQGNDVQLEVADTGIGIAEAEQRRIFERFYRVDRARSRELGGTGLGLSIVKHLAQSFGGSVGVRSTLGKGSVFWVRLPLAPNS
ncbi:MAG: ATP-binding protein, partial [Planctomycetales bacterium]|nr:ATP-binding protein [Planctomycetales bacterium]